jgi:hypothetical protein
MIGKMAGDARLKDVHLPLFSAFLHKKTDSQSAVCQESG